jgi:hypothetical protein
MRRGIIIIGFNSIIAHITSYWFTCQRIAWAINFLNKSKVATSVFLVFVFLSHCPYDYYGDTSFVNV